MSAACVL
jgi:hypothetical protein